MQLRWNWFSVRLPLTNAWHCHSLYTAFSSNGGTWGMWDCSLFLSVLLCIKYTLNVNHQYYTNYIIFTFIVTMRRSTWFPLASLLILLIGTIICFVGQCKSGRKNLTFVCGILFVLAGIHLNLLWKCIHSSSIAIPTKAISVQNCVIILNLCLIRNMKSRILIY